MKWQFYTSKFVTPLHKSKLQASAPCIFHPGSLLTLEEDGRLHVHERQRNKLGNAACAALHIAEGGQVARPGARAVAVAEHDGGGCAETHAVRGLYDLQRRPLLCTWGNGAQG